MNIPSGNLQLGSRGKNVADLQRELAAAGFNPGGADGIYGAHTRAAVASFQRAHHLSVDGVAGRQTWTALGGDRFESGGSHGGGAPSSGRIPGGALRQGSRGSLVADLQRSLAAKGFNPGGVDGDFGPHTRAALTSFQRANHIAVDGVAGPQTWRALGGDRFDPNGTHSASNGGSVGRGGPVANVGNIHVTSTMQQLAAAAKSTAMSMGGYRSEGLCATGVCRAIDRVMGFYPGGNGNTIGDHLPTSKFRQINIPLSEALKIPGLVLSWQHTPTAAGSIYGHTAVTMGNGESSASDFYEYNTLASSAGRTGLKIYMPVG